jgi:hypothetical protein
MKIILKLNTSITIDSSDIDPELIKAAIQNLDLFTDENGDEFKPQSDLSKEEWEDVIRTMLEDDIETVVSLHDEIVAGEFGIDVEDDAARTASPRPPL